MDTLKKMLKEIEKMNDEEKIKVINEIKIKLHEISPFKNEPVDCVVWVKNEKVAANDYNPNSVAPPEMELLKTSIMNDGYTQPIVAFDEKDAYTVVDGFHRSRVGKELEEVKNRVKGYLPITIIRDDRNDRGDRIAATIRHNRARGKHKIESMSDIVVELKRRNWSDKKISKQLGMDADEVLRLCQITGLEEMFKDKEFSQAWEPSISKELEIDFEEKED
jgi:ParB-like chromosome segregation protein Spo0J